MINNLYIKATPTTASVTWGDITGTLSDQTDLQSALDAKFDEPAGTVSQYVRGDGSLATFPTTLPPTGSAGGDLTGTYPNPTVHRVHGVDFQSGTPAVDDTWIYVSTPLGPQPFQWQHSKLKTSQVQNDSTVTGTNADDALEHLDSTKVPTTRTISTTAPLSGGGDLSANRTLSITQANTSTDGYLSSTDFNTFNGKQDALTLTTTGTSGAATLVGSTLNIPQYGGGGGSGIHAQKTIVSQQWTNLWTTYSTAPTTSAATSNRLYCMPFFPNQTFTCDALAINVTTLSVGGLAKILIFSDVDGVPTTKLYESADLNCSTTGQKTASTSFTFNAGTTYWLGFIANNSVNFFTFMQQSSIYGFSTSGAFTASTHGFLNTTFNSIPTTLTALTYATGNVPMISIKKA